MFLLLKAAIQNRKHYFLLIFTTLSMFAMTIATQLEILSLGVMTKAASSAYMGDQKAESTEGEQTEKSNLLYRLNSFLDKHFKIHENLPKLALFVILVALIKAVTLFVYRYFTQVIAIRVSRDLRQRCFEHVQTLPMSFYHKFEIATIASRVTGDAGTVAASINSFLTNYLQTPFTIVTVFCFMISLSWKLTILIVVGFPLIIIPVVFIARKIKHMAKSMARSNEICMRLLFEHLTGILTVKTFVMEAFNIKKFNENNRYVSKMQEQSARYGLASRPILHVVSSVFFAIVILSGLYLFKMDPSELLVYVGLMYAFYEPVKKFADENIQIQQGIVATERLFALLSETSTIVDEPDATPFTPIKEQIEFRNVSFGYNEGLVLQNVSFTVPRGEIVAIVGPTGAGKSTIVALLPRLYDIQQGDILFDGKSIKSFTIDSLRQHIAFVPQKPFLFLDSIRENIAIGRNYTDEEIQRAARNAHAEEFIVRMPNQYDYVLEEMGKNLSGGQQQRLAIARALATGAPILVMDEATSSLDAVSEEKIRDAILQQRGRLTQIIIAHRFSTIEHADKIIYIDHGRVIAQGNKQQLLASCPEFRQMWELMHLSDEQSQLASV